VIEKFINEYLAEQRAIPRESSGRFHVSDAGRCHLMRYWKRQATSPHQDFDDRAYRIFAVGHLFHLWIQGILKEKGVLISVEQKVEDEHRSGILDAIVQSSGKRILYDFKTVHSRKFLWIAKEADIHYHHQAMTYNTMISVPADEVRIAYISKDDLLIKEVPVFLTREKVDADWKPLIEAWVKQEPPKPTPLPWENAYCLYRESCWAVKEGLCKAKKGK